MNLLDRAKMMLQSRAPSSPTAVQYYDVFCPAGHRLSGTRTEGYQALRCPTCGEGIFVLPRSPLPEPPAPDPKHTRSRSTPPYSPTLTDEPITLTDPLPATEVKGTADLVDIDWEDSAPPAEAHRPIAEFNLEDISDELQSRKTDSSSAESGIRPGTAGSSRVPHTRKPGSSAAGRERTPARLAPSAGRAEDAPRTGRATRPVAAFLPADWVRRHRNFLSVLAVAVIVAGTVGFRRWRNRFEDYPRIAEIGRTEGLKALDEGRFDSAQQLLSRAKHAVEALGGKCEGAVEILRGASEAEIFVTLVGESLEAMIEEANPSESSSWPHRFDTLYKGRSVLIDAHVIAAPGEGGATQYDLDYRIFPNGEGGDRVRRGRIDLANFSLFKQAQVKAGSRVLFGAKLASFAFDGDEWLVGLEPDSGVFITHHEAVKALWPNVEELPEEGQP